MDFLAFGESPLDDAIVGLTQELAWIARSGGLRDEQDVHDVHDLQDEDEA
jgi:hypothetical protein